MNIEKYVVVSGFPGVHKLVSTRGNGLVIDDRVEKRTRFVAIRQNPVTPLGTIGIYIDTDEGSDTISLGDVFAKILEQLDQTPLPAASTANSTELRTWFTAILPNHDQDRVHINDIKKCVKWFTFMHENGIFEDIRNAAAEDAAEAAAVEAETTPVVEVAPEVVAEEPAKPVKAKAKKATK
jgi:hypothetical protein